VIIRPRNPDQLDDLLAGSDAVLTYEDLDRIADIVAPRTELNPANYSVPRPSAIEDKRIRRG